MSQESHKGKRRYHVKHSSYVLVFFVKSQIKQRYQGRYEDEEGDQTDGAGPDAQLDVAPDQGVDRVHRRFAPTAAGEAPVPFGGALGAESAMAMLAGSYRVRLWMIETSHLGTPSESGATLGHGALHYNKPGLGPFAFRLQEKRWSMRLYGV